MKVEKDEFKVNVTARPHMGGIFSPIAELRAMLLPDNLFLLNKTFCNCNFTQNVNNKSTSVDATPPKFQPQSM